MTTDSEGDEKEKEGTAANPALPVNAVLSKLEAMDNNIIATWSFEGSLYCKLINLEKIKIEDGGIGVIDRLLIDTPRSQQQGFQQRPGGFGGRESRPTFIGRAVRETRGRDRGRPTRYSGYSGATGPALGDRRPGYPPPPALGDRRPGHPPPLTDGDLTMRSDHRKGGRYPRFKTEGTSLRYSLTT
ncbi:hypothetical protein ACOMHN_051981 [Nucella lapillus]